MLQDVFLEAGTKLSLFQSSLFAAYCTATWQNKDFAVTGKLLDLPLEYLWSLGPTEDHNSAPHPGNDFAIYTVVLQYCIVKGSRGGNQTTTGLGLCINVASPVDSPESKVALTSVLSWSHMKATMFVRHQSIHVVRYEEHTVHACKHRLCPITRQLCKRLCSGDHLHSLSRGENHICGQDTRVAHCVLRLGYVKSIQLSSQSKLRLLEGRKRFSIPREAPSILKQWGSAIPLLREPMRNLWLSLHTSFGFGTTSYVRPRLTLVQDTLNRNTKPGATGLCHKRDGPLMAQRAIALSWMVVNSHQMRTASDVVHFVLHIDHERMVPNPDQDKDWITHGLHWRRSAGSLDSYSREDQANFAKCDAMCPVLSLNCPGPEHTANAQPSRCTLSMFHPPVDVANAPDGLGYASNDGHHFRSRKPIVM
ncbi:hypothetical protein V8E53_014125 [Lactarius tabidus]